MSLLLVATIVSLLPASPVGAPRRGRDIELIDQVLRESGHHVLSTRDALEAIDVAGRVRIDVVVAGVLAGFGAWVGAASQGVDLSLATMLGAGLNVVPTALVVLGVGAVVLAVAPRAAGRTVYGIVIGSLLIDLLSSLIVGLHWLEHLSLFHYMSLALAHDADPRTIVVVMATAVALVSWQPRSSIVGTCGRPRRPDDRSADAIA